MSSASLTTIPTDVCNYCFEFLEDKDLRSARWTSSLFLKAFCRRYQGSATPTVGQCWSYIILCQLGFKFANVTHLNVQLPYESLLFRFITMANFPRVTSMILNYVHLGCMPVNSNVRFLTMVGCTFTGKRPRKKERLFPFFNVQDLRIESGSALSPICGLPNLQQLRRGTRYRSLWQPTKIITNAKSPGTATMSLQVITSDYHSIKRLRN